jgi:hypothetical protein
LEGKRGVFEGDTYICTHCNGVATILKPAFGIDSKATFDGPANCKFGILTLNENKAGIAVKLHVNFNNRFGANPIDASLGTVHKCVQCPPEFSELYHSGYWIDIGITDGGQSTPIRLLPNEFEILN